jgi:hypothetical protein
VVGLCLVNIIVAMLAIMELLPVRERGLIAVLCFLSSLVMALLAAPAVANCAMRMSLGWRPDRMTVVVPPPTASVASDRSLVAAFCLLGIIVAVLAIMELVPARERGLIAVLCFLSSLVMVLLAGRPGWHRR